MFCLDMPQVAQLVAEQIDVMEVSRHINKFEREKAGGRSDGQIDSHMSNARCRRDKWKPNNSRLSRLRGHVTPPPVSGEYCVVCGLSRVAGGST